MKKASVVLMLLLMVGATHAEIVGTWNGVAKAPKGDQHVVMHIAKGPRGELAVTLDSTDEEVNGIQVKSAVLKGDELTLDVPAVQASFKGTVSKDGPSISGAWTHKAIPLKFTRAK